MKDVLDLLSTAKVENYVQPPQKYKSTRGQDMFGYPPEMLPKAAAYYYSHMNSLEFDEASTILKSMKESLAIEECSLIIKRALFGNYRSISFLKEKTNPAEIILELYSRYLEQSQAEIKALLDNASTIYTERWNEVVPDEDNVTPEQLNIFYNSFPFPVGCFLQECAKNNLVLAYRALPILLADANGSKKIFDFGGNSGLVTSSMASMLDLDVCMLIEENTKMLNFAKWRDDLFGIKNVIYKKESEICSEIADYTGFFDFGVCTEVLEHAYFVEETVAVMAQMLKQGALLYQSASFGLYPEPSHLKKNLCYAGKEDELMNMYGFDRITGLNLPIPVYPNIRIYVKR